MLARAIEAEVADWIGARAHLADHDGRRQVVRNGSHPERDILTGPGPIPVKQPRALDRRPPDREEVFRPGAPPRHLRRTEAVGGSIPWPYPKGVSTGDFPEAPAAPLGPDAGGPSPSTVTRIKSDREGRRHARSRRPLAGEHCVYVRADGVHFNIRLEQDRRCILVLIGATAEGAKELIAAADGYRESEQSWEGLLLDAKARGLEIEPHLAIGDGPPGFWKAVRRVRPTTREQRCWVHKTANVLGKLPEGSQAEAKGMLREAFPAEGRAAAEKAFALFVATYGAEHPEATECPAKDRDELLASYDFPAEHRRHIRTTDPIESAFATVRLRHDKAKGAGAGRRAWR